MLGQVLSGQSSLTDACRVDIFVSPLVMEEEVPLTLSQRRPLSDHRLGAQNCRLSAASMTSQLGKTANGVSPWIGNPGMEILRQLTVNHHTGVTFWARRAVARGSTLRPRAIEC